MKAASAAWDRILTTFPDSKTFKSIAESRVKRLSSTDSREFYAWFSTQNPKPGDDLLMPQDGGPGQVPSTPMFPDLHNFGLPNVDASTPAAPAENPANVETPATETPATETPSDPAAESPATPPATEAPPTEAPVGETPVPEKSGE